MRKVRTQVKSKLIGCVKLGSTEQQQQQERKRDKYLWLNNNFTWFLFKNTHYWLIIELKIRNNNNNHCFMALLTYFCLVLYTYWQHIRNIKGKYSLFQFTPQQISSTFLGM